MKNMSYKSSSCGTTIIQKSDYISIFFFIQEELNSFFFIFVKDKHYYSSIGRNSIKQIEFNINLVVDLVIYSLKYNKYISFTGILLFLPSGVNIRGSFHIEC